jgi:hypothetical protein
VETVDIEAHPELFERHRYRIPVVELDGREIAWGRISEKGLEWELARRSREKPKP